MNIINVSWPKDYSDVIKANLIPGKPLAVIGPHGLAKIHCTTKAIEQMNMSKHIHNEYSKSWLEENDVSFYMLFSKTLNMTSDMAFSQRRDMFNNTFIKKYNSLSGNTVLIIDEIDRIANQGLSDMVINQLSNPDRIVVISGITAPSHILERCATVINVKAPWDK